MTFINKLGKKIGNVAGNAADKAKDLAEITKLNASISSEEKQINQYYLEIGKIMFEHEKDNPNSPVAEQIGKILASQQTIAEIKAKIAEIKTDNDVSVPNTCPNCQTENSGNSKFCPNCGTPFPDQ